jgi:hypothetical protein
LLDAATSEVQWNLDFMDVEAQQTAGPLLCMGLFSIFFGMPSRRSRALGYRDVRSKYVRAGQIIDDQRIRLNGVRSLHDTMPTNYLQLPADPGMR